MATSDERAALLSVACTHCGALPDQRCFTLARRHGREVRLPITTLDGASHDARWLIALGRSAPVLLQRVPA